MPNQCAGSLDAASWISVASLAVTIAAIWWAHYQLKHAKLSSSASVLLGVHQALRELLLQYAKAEKSEDKVIATAELFNMLEIACAILDDQLGHGRTHAILNKYVLDYLVEIQRNEALSIQMQQLVDKPDTFIHICNFIERNRAALAKAPQGA